MRNIGRISEGLLYQCFRYTLKRTIRWTSEGEIVELIPGKNFQKFNGTFYKKEIGLTQGSKCSPEVADV
jgi:hypothetical protein